jgi:hypothetical protein
MDIEIKTIKDETVGNIIAVDIGKYRIRHIIKDDYYSLVHALRHIADVINLDFMAVEIFGADKASRFKMKVTDNVESVCQDIWNHPSKYSEYQDNTDEAYYEFLKFLWVRFPDGTEERLADCVLNLKINEHFGIQK